MASHDFELSNPPEIDTHRDLWLQHAAGLIVFEDVRNYAIHKIPEGTDTTTRSKIIAGIDDAVYGLMMVFDGVTGSLKSADYEVSLNTVVSVRKNNDEEGKVLRSVDLINGDGMCVGYHGWKEGDFGDEVAAVRETDI